jgi:hypothetical protein
LIPNPLSRLPWQSGPTVFVLTGSQTLSIDQFLAGQWIVMMVPDKQKLSFRYKYSWPIKSPRA